MSIAVRFGEDSIVDQLIELHKEATSPDLRSDISGALATTKKPGVARKLIGLLKDPEHVRPQDLLRWYILILRNRHTRVVAWDWLVENWTWVEETFASSKSYDAYPRYSAGSFSTQQWLKKYEDFFKPMENELSLERNIKIGIKEIAARVTWRRRDQAAVESWLKENS